MKSIRGSERTSRVSPPLKRHFASWFIRELNNNSNSHGGIKWIAVEGIKGDYNLEWLLSDLKGFCMICCLPVFFHYLHDTNWMISNGSCCCSFWIKSNISWIFLTDLFKRIPLAQTHNQSDLNGLKMYIRNASLTKIKNKNKMERRRWQVINKKTSFFACLYLIKRPSLLLSSELRKDS